MFIKQLAELVGSEKFSFQVEHTDKNLCFTVIPQTPAPECNGAAEKGHAALAIPLRIKGDSGELADRVILDEMQAYMNQREGLKSNLTELTKAIAETTKTVKQEAKSKSENANRSGKGKEKPAGETEGATKTPTKPKTETRKLDL